MIEFSVIVLLYNAAEDALERTLDSILCQEDISYEIIIADDASANDCMKWTQSYLDAKGQGYIVSGHKENVGTVRNIRDALQYAHGKYIKCIGAGDLLFAKDTLKNVREFMQARECAMCFTKMQGYCMNDEGVITFLPFCHPGDIQAFLAGNEKRIRENILVNHDWISGAAMFYDREIFRKYLSEIDGCVKYCEDVLQAILLLEGERIAYYDKAGIYYEMGSGISTGSSGGSSTRMQTDHQHFWGMLREKYSHPMVQRGYQMYQCEIKEGRVKRILAILLCNPGCLLHHWRMRRQRKFYKITE